MLGWWITIIKGDRLDPLNHMNFPTERILATWEIGLFGLDWAYQLDKEGKVIEILAGGYPCIYAGLAKDILPAISGGIPSTNSPLTLGDDYFRLPGEVSEVRINHELVRQCDPNERLFIQAWDLS